MLRTITVGFSVLLAGCSTLPEKPVVEVGAIDYAADQAIVGLSDGSDAVHRVPLTTYDKATCFRPTDWEPLKVYIKLIEDYAKRCKMAQEVSK